MTQINWIDKYLTDAEQLIYNNELEKGLHMLNGLLYEEPGYGRLHNHIGWAYMYYTTDAAKAELHLKMAIHFDEAFTPAYLHLGTLYNRQGRYKEAVAILQTGVTIPGAQKLTMLENMAHAYELQGELNKALQTYKQAAMASVSGHEVDHLLAGIKRCRKKRVALFFTF